MASTLGLFLEKNIPLSVTEVFSRQINSRSKVTLKVNQPGEVNLYLKIQPALPEQSFVIQDAAGGIIISGQDLSGLVAGLGKFLRTSAYACQEFSPSSWRGTSTPEKAVRGIYFATHFHNWYHMAPVEKIKDYIQDLALWGFNAINVWFDMHHYHGKEDPAAREMIARLRFLLQAARDTGMKPSFALLANEGYANSPVHLRAKDTGRSHFGVEICPSLPEGRLLILDQVRQECEFFSDLEPGFVWIWPYDQGGCSCHLCSPWGANAYLKISQEISRIIRKMLPSARIVLSTWLFDDQEWEGLAKAFIRKPEWVDYLMADSHTTYPEFLLKNPVPGKLPLLNFPEISMWGLSPWPGYGANPLPERFQALWDSVKHLVSGGFPYSEGIYEDINKVLYSQFYWSAEKKASATLREYIAFEFSPQVVEDVLAAIAIMEKNHRHRAITSRETSFTERIESEVTESALECLHLLSTAEKVLPGERREQWRWKILKIRATIDAELYRGKGKPTRLLEDCFDQLRQLFYAESADGSCRIPRFQV